MDYWQQLKEYCSFYWLLVGTSTINGNRSIHALQSFYIQFDSLVRNVSNEADPAPRFIAICLLRERTAVVDVLIYRYHLLAVIRTKFCEMASPELFNL